MVEISKERIKKLENIASKTRELIIHTVYHAKAGHVGGPLSATDILTVLYNEILNIDSDNPKWEARDRFVLSKGHSAIALYATLAQCGFFPIEELKTFDGMHSRLQAHPDKLLLPGLDMSTGSLGQGISTAVGMALGAKLKNENFITHCMIGDGETQEGQVWEAADVACKYSLDNLVVVMDYNKLQQYGWEKSGSNREKPIRSPEIKWSAFGWHVISINGHNMEEIISAYKEAKSVQKKPVIIIAHTTKGKGVSFAEGDFSWHSKVPSAEELSLAMEEIAVRRGEKIE